MLTNARQFGPSGVIRLRTRPSRHTDAPINASDAPNSRPTHFSRMPNVTTQRTANEAAKGSCALGHPAIKAEQFAPAMLIVIKKSVSQNLGRKIALWERTPVCLVQGRALAMVVAGLARSAITST